MVAQPAATPFRLEEGEGRIRLNVGEGRLSMHHGDVTQLKADALVCPVDSNLDFRSGVAQAIGQAAGRSVHAHRPAMNERFGKVVVLPGGDLNVKYIFLTVLLGESGLDKMRLSIAQAVDRTVRYAEFLRLQSIAFPLLGCADALPPYQFLAQQMIENVASALQRKKCRLKAVFFSLYNRDAFEAFRKEARSLAGR